ncbi:hypothetical protein SBA3_1080015 [Candidatus Sulfopaludibacter sp. SbA3]|nr:hypothetical protein SBA3_1080015 [Candidatus Sulfopaludibacter sp. SbA3]
MGSPGAGPQETVATRSGWRGMGQTLPEGAPFAGSAVDTRDRDAEPTSGTAPRRPGRPLHRRHGPSLGARVSNGGREPHRLQERAHIVEPLSQARLAITACGRFGKGMGHRAQLNFGACAVYALAVSHGGSLTRLPTVALPGNLQRYHPALLRCTIATSRCCPYAYLS